MTIVRQLFSLQEIDLALDSVRSQKATAERERSARLVLENIEEALAEEQTRLQEIQASHRERQEEAEHLRQRSQTLQDQLFSGELTNPRDLASLELESSNVKAQVDQKDIQLLDLSVRAQDTRNRIEAHQEELSTLQAEWEKRHAELTEQIESLTEEENSLTAERDKLAETLDQSEVLKYDNLRRSKGGTAVAKVERGLCQACRMSLPTQHLQRVRSGRYTVNCSSCGRLLFPG